MSSANISAGPLKCLRGEQSDPNHVGSGCVDVSLKVVTVT